MSSVEKKNMQKPLRWVRDNIMKSPQRGRDVAIAAALLLALLLVLLSPTMQELRTIEHRGENEQVPLTATEPLTQTMYVPIGEPTYFLVWAHEGSRSNTLSAADYKSIELTIRQADGPIIRTATRPGIIKRRDRTALLFTFEPLRVNETQLYDFILRQTGEDTVNLLPPLPAHVKYLEEIPVAAQLNEKRNWLTLLFANVYERDIVTSDIAMYLHRGKQIASGTNPYSCVTGHEACIGYPAHLPGIYLVSAGLVKLGVENLDQWEAIWRPVAITAWLGIAATIFIYAFRRGRPALAVAGLGFWLFNRWSIEVLHLAHTDFLAVLFLLLATILAGPLPLLAATLIGISLSVKQVGIVIVPLFLIIIWRQQQLTAKRFAAVIALLVAIPLLSTIPFLINDFDATIIGITDVASRDAHSPHGLAPSLDQVLDVTHAGKTAPLLLLIISSYIAAWRKKVNLIAGTLIIFASLIAFTPVLYNQYLVWLLPFIPLAIADSPYLKSPSRS